MKNKILTVLFFFSFSYYSQISLGGSVKDYKSKEPIPYCAISLKSELKGCLSNEEGIFTIVADISHDTLLITYVGYTTKQLAVRDFVKDNVIYLDRKETILNEVTVHGYDDYLYSAFEKCRQKLSYSKEEQSKVYYVLESEIGGQPVELLECYYNGQSNNTSVKDLVFKNGRVGLASYNDRYFINMNVSKAFNYMDLLNGNVRLPSNPLQYNKKKLKKYFRLSLKTSYDHSNPVYNISFMPVTDNGKFFSGEAWIEKNTGYLKKLTLKIDNTTHHPFIPALVDYGEIESVSMQIIKTFAAENNENRLSHINFDYKLYYRHLHQTYLLNNNRDTTFEVKSKGLMYFYDYGRPFIPPYFTYDNNLSDYRKISALTYNDQFWSSNNSLVYSEKMKKGIMFFKNNGHLINYKNINSTKQHDTKVFRGSSFSDKWGFETNYMIWSDRLRVSLKNNHIKNDTVFKNGETFMTNRYKLRAQLFMDLNPMADSVQHYSASIFDVFETYYNIPEEPFTNCFINIYFDLFEIERREMEKTIALHKYSVAQFDSLYKQTVKRLDEQTSYYLKQVERGKNFTELQKWNELVKLKLGIDNIAIFQLKAQNNTR